MKNQELAILNALLMGASALSPLSVKLKSASLRNNSAYGKKRRAKNRMARASRRRNRK
jgi:hypothetical protein